MTKERSDAPRLFGTDGIRDVAGSGRLEPNRITHIGRAIGRRLVGAPSKATPRVLLGRDTRASGTAIASLLAGGLQAEGVDVVDAGVVPTPGLAIVTRSEDFDLGIVISASHNPARDNGIKILSAIGEKITEADERAIESEVASLAHGDPSLASEPRPAPMTGTFERRSELVAAYRAALLERHTDLDLEGLRVAIDCANGAGYAIAPDVLAKVGATAVRVACEPDGTNINLDCGATSPETVRTVVAEGKADLGIALDGDGDRVVFVDENGELRDGDHALYVLGRSYRDEGRLEGDTIVATVMSNLGLEIALRHEEIRLVRTDVGDKHVAAEMKSHGYALGGEQSGHVVMRHGDHLSGDGLGTALAVLAVLRSTGSTLADATSAVERCPQVLRNVRVKSKPPLGEVPGLVHAVAEAEEALGNDGRVLLRYSGTEPIARVMVEGTDGTLVERLASSLESVVREELGEVTA